MNLLTSVTEIESGIKDTDEHTENYDDENCDDEENSSSDSDDKEKETNNKESDNLMDIDDEGHIRIEEDHGCSAKEIYIFKQRRAKSKINKIKSLQKLISAIKEAKVSILMSTQHVNGEFITYFSGKSWGKCSGSSFCIYI